MPEPIRKRSVSHEKVYQAIPDAAGTIVNKFQGLKSIVKLVGQPLTFAVDRLKGFSKEVPEPLKLTSSAFSNITGFLCSLEIIHKIRELAHGTPWKGKSFIDGITFVPSWAFKTGKNLCTTISWSASFFSTTSKVIATAVRWLGPIANVLEILGFSFTLAHQGIKLNHSFDKVKKYRKKQVEWKERGVEWNKTDPQSILNDVATLAREKMYGNEVSKYRSDGSLIGRIDQKVNLVTVKSLSNSFFRNVRAGSLFKFGFHARMTDVEILRKVRVQLKTYMVSDQKEPSAILKKVIRENKKIDGFINKHSTLHLKWRKWELLQKYVDTNDPKISLAQKGIKLCEYAKEKAIDKSNAIKDQKTLQKRSWYDVAFAIFVISIATLSLLTFFFPVPGLAIPCILGVLMLSTNILSFKRFLEDENILKTIQARKPVKIPSLHDEGSLAY